MLTYGDDTFTRVIYNSYEQCIIMFHFNIINTAANSPESIELNRVTYTIKTHLDFLHTRLTEWQSTLRITSQIATTSAPGLYTTYGVPCQKPHYYFHPTKNFFFYPLDEAGANRIVAHQFTYNTAGESPTGACDVDFDTAGGISIDFIDITVADLASETDLFGFAGSFYEVNYLMDKSSEGYDRIFFWEDYAYVVVWAGYSYDDSGMVYLHGEVVMKWETTQENEVTGSNTFTVLMQNFDLGDNSRFGTIVTLV